MQKGHTLSQDQQRPTDHCRICHSFYEKPITSPLLFHAKGAHGFRTKLVTLTEELRRRLLHMDQHHSHQDILQVAQKFITKMEDSGYSHNIRKEVIVSAVKKTYRQKMIQDTGGPSLYRTKEEMKAARKYKGMATQLWFKSKRGGHNNTKKKDLPWDKKPGHRPGQGSNSNSI